jgi:hypothetical protein
MDRSIPVFNRLVVDKMNQHLRDCHQRALATIRRRAVSLGLRESPPGGNAKAVQLEEERRTIIEKENVILFNKMHRIYNKRSSPHSYIVPHNSTRLRELERIQLENRGIVDRIERQKPTMVSRRQQLL